MGAALVHAEQQARARQTQVSVNCPVDSLPARLEGRCPLCVDPPSCEDKSDGKGPKNVESFLRPTKARVATPRARPTLSVHDRHPASLPGHSRSSILIFGGYALSNLSTHG